MSLDDRLSSKPGEPDGDITIYRGRPARPRRGILQYIGVGRIYRGRPARPGRARPGREILQYIGVGRLDRKGKYYNMSG